MKISKNRIIIWAIVILLLLLIPLVAMQFSDEVNWGLFDFVIMGAVLSAIGVSYELIARKSKKMVYRLAFGIGLIGSFLLFWVNSAVGMIGNEGQDANFLYGAVFVVGLIGSLIAKFKAHGMSNTLFAAATVQMLVPVVAIIIWPPPTTSWAPNVLGVFLLSAFFAYLFVVSAMLFKKAASNDNLSI